MNALAALKERINRDAPKKRVENGMSILVLKPEEKGPAKLSLYFQEGNRTYYWSSHAPLDDLHASQDSKPGTITTERLTGAYYDEDAKGNPVLGFNVEHGDRTIPVELHANIAQSLIDHFVRALPEDYRKITFRVATHYAFSSISGQDEIAGISHVKLHKPIRRNGASISTLETHLVEK